MDAHAPVMGLAVITYGNPGEVAVQEEVQDRRDDETQSIGGNAQQDSNEYDAATYLLVEVPLQVEPPPAAHAANPDRSRITLARSAFQGQIFPAMPAVLPGRAGPQFHQVAAVAGGAKELYMWRSFRIGWRSFMLHEAIPGGILMDPLGGVHGKSTLWN